MPISSTRWQGYCCVFADHAGLARLAAKYGATSYTIHFDVAPDGDGGEFNFSQMVFGPWPQKQKWRRDPQ
ncbi:hypothetical protein [Phenylobacterium sp.]|uniref:hypothetical protein n=1 Tax=Phenylobacterium sp. TaxID=1871053 RepID=UPI0025D9466B|nr:hypothetical protein [Phenylobacterium sp.]